jgi:hypothetical protein
MATYKTKIRKPVPGQIIQICISYEDGNNITVEHVVVKSSEHFLDIASHYFFKSTGKTGYKFHISKDFNFGGYIKKVKYKPYISFEGLYFYEGIYVYPCYASIK